MYYLNWLRVIIIGMVFVGHTMMPFTGAPWLITSDSIARLSALIATTALVAFLIAPWNPLRAIFGMRRGAVPTRSSTREPTTLS